LGGGFGMKSMTYPEYVPLAQAARLLGRPLRWTAARGEAMLSDNAARDLVAVAELGFDAGLRITAYRCQVQANLGAYNSMFAQMIQSVLFSRVLTGAYDIPAAHLLSEGFFTTTTPVDAYRGAGRPEAILTLECAMDHAARQLGVSPADLRRRSLVRRFPHAMVNGETIMDGDFARVLDTLDRRADLAGFAARRTASAARGLLRGGGLGQYVEAILGDPSETARIALNPDGTLSLYVGTQSNGQGHETVFAQLVSDRTGVPVDRIRFVQGDSDLIAVGGGTGGSRSVTTQGTATVQAIGTMLEAFAAFLDLGPGTAFDPAAGTFGAPGSNLRLTLAEAADRARAAGRADLLSHSATIRIDRRSFPNGAHWAEVEIDPETGAVTVDRHVVVDDFGNLLSPTLVEGQVQGGIAQGWGQVMAECLAMDAQGQVLAGSLMDYAMPRAADLPRPDWHSEPVPTATNPLGIKGCGEAGTVGALPALANAVADALAQRGAACAMPFTPCRIWQALHGAD
jgi:carbon-monoxide dehydrogenase large subunit